LCFLVIFAFEKYDDDDDVVDDVKGDEMKTVNYENNNKRVWCMQKCLQGDIPRYETAQTILY